MLPFCARSPSSPIIQQGRPHFPVGALTDCLDATAPNTMATGGWTPSVCLQLLHFFRPSDGKAPPGEGPWPGWKGKDSSICGRVDMLDEILVLGRLRHPNITMVAVSHPYHIGSHRGGVTGQHANQKFVSGSFMCTRAGCTLNAQSSRTELFCPCPQFKS